MKYLFKAIAATWQAIELLIIVSRWIYTSYFKVFSNKIFILIMPHLSEALVSQYVDWLEQVNLSARK